MKKILIVDDEKPISDIIKFNMTKEGYEVVTAFNGREAIELFETEKPDIIILDLMLPEIDGLEVAKTIRKTSSVPIIMLSGMIFPIESMPRILQYVSAIVPTRYYTSAMRKLMIMGVGIEQVYRETTILMGMLVVLLSLSLAKFNKRLE